MSTPIDIKGLQELRAKLAQFSDRRFNAALATAMSRTAVRVRDEIKAQMPRIFDRPTAYTLNSIYAKTTTAAALDARVGFKDESAVTRGTPASKYLLPGVQGGARRVKRFERMLQSNGVLPAGYVTVPAPGALLDNAGNLHRSVLGALLQQVVQDASAGPINSRGAGARRGAIVRHGQRYFVVRPGARIAPGIYQRDVVGRGVSAVLLFVKRVNYGKRFDFYGEAQRRTQVVITQEMTRAVGDHLKRLAQQGRP